MVASPSGANGIISGAFLLIFALIWISISYSMPMFPVNILFSLIGVLLIGVAARNIYLAFRPVRAPKDEGSEDDEAPQPYTGYCPSCGMPVDEGQSFCSACGRKL